MREPELGQNITLIEKSEPKKVKVTDILGNKYQIGGAYDKVKLEAATQTLDKEGRKMRIIVKDVKDKFNKANVFSEEVVEMSSAERYIAKWNVLKNNHLPTVSSIRIVDGNTVAMGDMTADGGKFFGKEIVCRVYEKENVEKRHLTSIEEVFLSINPRDIMAAINKLYRSAWEKGIILPDDDPYDLLVHTDGKWEVLILDLTELRPRRADDSLDNLEREIRFSNQDVNIIRDYLLKVKINERS